MSFNTQQIIDIILKAGSISGLISLVFTIKDQIKKRSKFKFDFRGYSGKVSKKDNLEFYDIVFNGYVKNQSNEQNSITDIYYVIWQNKSRTRTLTNGMGAEIFDANSQDKLSLPLFFEAKEGKNLIIKFSVCLTGTHVKELVYSFRPIKEGSPFMLPKHDFTLAFKDVNEILFDDTGQFRSQKLMDLWWTLPNTFNSLKTGNPLPYFWHILQIFFSYICYKIKSFLIVIGF